MSELEKQVYDLKNTNTFLLEAVASLGLTIAPQLSWRICNITEALKPPTPYGTAALQSEPFYSSANGYKLKVSFYPRGSKSRKKGYVSVYLIIMKGEYDDALPWPFRHKVIFTLIDQQENLEKRRNIVRELVPDINRKWHARACAKPTEDGKTGKGKTDCRSRKQKRKNKPITMHVPALFLPLLLTYDSDNLVFI